MAGWQTDKRIFTTQKIKQGPSTGVVWDCLFHEYSFFPVHFSRLYRRHLSKEKRPQLWTSRAHRTYRGRVFSQQFLTRHMRTEQKREKQVSNRTDSSVSVDERQIRESRGGWQRSLPLPDLSRKIEGPLLAGYPILVPRAYDLFCQRWDRRALVSAITGCREIHDIR